MSKVRINVYIRSTTKLLLDDFAKSEEWDLSTAVDIILRGRLEYMEKAKLQAQKELEKEENKTKKTKYNNTEEMEKAFKDDWNKITN